MFMMPVQQWSVEFDLPEVGRVTWTVNGEKELAELVQIFIWNKVERFEVRRANDGDLYR